MKEKEKRDSQQTEGMFFTASFAFIYLVKYFQSPEIVSSQDNQVAGSKIKVTRNRGRSANKRGPKKYLTNKYLGTLKPDSFHINSKAAIPFDGGHIIDGIYIS